MSKICDFLIFEPPFPPSQNATKKMHVIKGKPRLGRTKEYEQYIKTFTRFWLSVRTGGKLDFGKQVMFWTITCPKRAGCDTDNYHKVILDCMEIAGAFGLITEGKRKGKPVPDNVIVSTHNERGPRVTDGLMRCYIANEKHRAECARRYWEDFESNWLPYREGPILKPRSAQIQRVIHPDPSVNPSMV